MGDAVSHTFRQMQNGTGLFYGWFEAMHSRFDLLTVGPTENEAAALCRDIAAEIRRIENRLNRFDEASDVWQINQNTFYDKCPADPGVARDFRRCAALPRNDRRGVRYCDPNAGILAGGVLFRGRPRLRSGSSNCVRDAIFDFGGYGKDTRCNRLSAC